MKLNKIIMFVMAMLCLSSVGYSTLENNNIAYWTLDNNLLDSTGNDNMLTNNGATYTNTGKINDAYNFDINDYLYLEDISTILNDSWSISLWIDADSTAYSYIFTFGVTNNDRVYMTKDSTGTKLDMVVEYGGAGSTYTTINTLNSGYNHIVVNWDNDNSRTEVYLNNVLEINQTGTGSTQITGNDILYLGGNSGSGGLIGELDEIGLFTSVLTPSEIEILYNDGDGIQYPFTNIPEMTSDITDFYNTSTIDITLSNDWISEIGINDDLVFSDFINVDLADNGGLIELDTLSNDFTNLFNTNLLGLAVLSNTPSIGDIWFDDLNACTGSNCYIGLKIIGESGSEQYFNDVEQDTLDFMCDQLGGSNYISHTSITSSIPKNTVHTSFGGGGLGRIFGTTSSTSFEYLSSITCGTGDYITTGTLTKSYTTTSNLDTFTLTDTKNLNSQTITSYLYYNGTEYSLSSPLTLSIPSGSDIELRYYFTGTTTQTPQLSDITFTASDSNEIPQVEMFYSLNGASDISLGNTTLTTFQVTGIEGLNNISFSLVSDTGNSTLNETFTIDTIAPTITNNIALETNSYQILFNGSICNDNNLDECNIVINAQNKDLLVDTNITSTISGNISYTITSTDLAGNSLIENGIILVNPLQCNNFFRSDNSSPITDYTFNDLQFPSNPACFKTYNNGLVLGSNTLIFEKLGFATTNITFNITTASELNLIHNITRSEIVLKIYDRETNNLITQNVSITLIGTQGFSGSTVTGELNISDINFLNEQYQIIVETLNYSTETLFFSYDNQETLNVNIYPISTDSTDYGIVNIVAVADTGQFVNGAICKVLEWIPSTSSFETRSQGETNLNGVTVANIEIGTKAYKFRCSKDDVEAESTTSIISSTDSTVTLTLTTSTQGSEGDLKYLDFELYNTTYNSTHQTIFYDWEELNGLSVTACLNVYQILGINKIELHSDCSDTNSGQLQKIINVNTSYNIEVEAYIEIDNNNKLLDKLVFLGSDSIGSQLSKYRLDILIPLLFTIIGIIIGLVIKPQNIYISAIASMIMVWFSVAIVPGIVSFNIALIVNIICGMMLWGGNRQ